jgi:hypothetical protein
LTGGSKPAAAAISSALTVKPAAGHWKKP